MAKKQKVKLTKHEKWFKTLHRLIKVVYPFVPYKKHGHTAPFNDRSYLFVCNHRSLFDVIIAAVATDRPVHFIAKKDLFKKGLMKKFVTKSECIPVNRDGNDLKALLQSIKYLKNNENVVIFPEGTRNKTEEPFLTFKSGAAAISIKSKTPIVPIVQVKKFKMFRKNHAIYGEPIEFSDYYDKKVTEEDLAECDKILLKNMTDLYNTLTAELKRK